MSRKDRKQKKKSAGGKTGKRVKISNIILALVFVTGLALLLYPTFSDWWNSFHQTRAIVDYADTVDALDSDVYEALIASAKEYNTALFESGHGLGLSEEEYEDYEAQLKLGSTSIMGYLEIDKIDVYLPFYHGTSSGTLSSAIGHLEGTSLPVGGESTHAVLSGHRGLTSARLFTDLDQLVEGDTFVIHVLNETLTYEVDQILIVLPTETSALSIVEGEDYCTLLTCTPYGVNTHRLLVRGHRIDNIDTSTLVVSADAVQISSSLVAFVLAGGMVLVLFIVIMLRPANKKRK